MMARYEKKLAMFAASFMIACCATTQKPKGGAKSTKKSSGGKALSMAELTDNDVALASRTTQNKPTRKKSVAYKPLPEGDTVLASQLQTRKQNESSATKKPLGQTTTLEACQEAVQKYATTLQRLYPLLPANTYQPGNVALDQTLTAKASQCDGDRQAITQAIEQAVAAHSGRVGVVLPLTGQRGKLAAYVLNGMRAAVREAGLSFENAVVVKDSGGRNAETKLAELVLKDRVMAVVGGLEKAEADALAPYAGGTATPMVLMGRDRELTQQDGLLYRLYPDEKRLADTLVQAAAQRGYKRIAMLRPSNKKSDKITDYFRKGWKERGGSVIHDLIYTPDNFESMSAVGRTLFQTDAAERRDEYRRAYFKARKRADAEGVPFDPRMVVLKPIVDFDAVFLPDDFRTVRHFAKLFKFHMVDKLPLIGNHEWRSPALIEPFDPFLEGSLFADFIGSYSKVPASIAAPTLDSPYFVRPEAVVPVDFQLIGYRAGRVIAMMLTGGPNGGAPLDKRAVQKLLPELKSDPSGAAAFSGAKVFDAERHANWPTFLFSVQKDRIALEQEPSVTVPQPSQQPTANNKAATLGAAVPRT